MNFYPFHIGDYISHTSHLSDAEDLAYRRMIDLYYQTEKPFQEKDKAKIARRVKSTVEIVETILHEFFEYSFDDGDWHNKRADEEIAKYHAKAESARKANQIRWDKKSDLKSDADQILTKNHEPITKNQDKPIGAKRATQIPKHYIANEGHHDLAKSLGVDLLKELAQFQDHHEAKGSTMKDWDAALRTWIRNAAKFAKPGAAAGKPKAQWSGFDEVDYGETGAIK